MYTHVYTHVHVCMYMYVCVREMWCYKCLFDCENTQQKTLEANGFKTKHLATLTEVLHDVHTCAHMYMHMCVCVCYTHMCTHVHMCICFVCA